MRIEYLLIDNWKALGGNGAIVVIPRDTSSGTFEVFKEKKMPAWGPDLSGVNFDDIYYYSQSSIGEADSWEEVPKQIKDTYVKLGIPEEEQKYLAGVKAQWDSEVVYGSVLKTLKKKGVVFMSMDEGLEKYPDLVRRFIGSVVLPEDN